MVEKDDTASSSVLYTAVNGDDELSGAEKHIHTAEGSQTERMDRIQAMGGNSALCGGADMYMKWIQERPHTKGEKFFCSECGKEFYYPQGNRKSTIKPNCPYPYCPWCLEKMEEKRKYKPRSSKYSEYYE